MMKPNQTLLGVQSPGDELEIRGFSRITRDEETFIGLFDGTAGPVVGEHRKVLIDAWSGETESGLTVHVAYRFGELTIDVDLPTPGGGRCPLTVLRWKPRLALALAAPERLFGAGLSAALREERARLAEANAEMAEIRAQNGGETRLLSEGELRHWLAERNRHFGFLAERGLAGGRLRFRLAEAKRKEAEAA
jgi:hypothetical protein